LLNVRITRDGHGIQADLSSLHLNEAVLAPLLAPLILAHPEQTAISPLLIIVAPSNKFDSMSTDHLTGDMRINTGFIVSEVLVDGETDHHGAVFKEFSLDFFEIRHNLHGTRLAIVLCILFLGVDTPEIAG
jgi:hypothetical protein